MYELYWVLIVLVEDIRKSDNICLLEFTKNHLQKIRNWIFFYTRDHLNRSRFRLFVTKTEIDKLYKTLFFQHLFVEQNVYNSNTNNNENWFQALQNSLYFVTRNYVTKSSTLIRLLILKSLKNKKANILYTTIIKYMSEGKYFIFICNTNFVLCYTNILTSSTSYPPRIYEMVLWKK